MPFGMEEECFWEVGGRPGVGIWGCGDSRDFLADLLTNGKRQLRTDHASVRRHAETVLVAAGRARAGCIGRQDLHLTTTFVLTLGYFFAVFWRRSAFPEHLEDKM
jgi:hypothetical protein